MREGIVHATPLSVPNGIASRCGNANRERPVSFSVFFQESWTGANDIGKKANNFEGDTWSQTRR
ncbi:hypothetical protein SCLCIDRAFT_1223375 [Scleroderma citrinum Foug A]|uniref:Uncharacterized protein n=1 Tax=Scleroderma citrinum Foug A TaxID=1036808 RepID=A0A0C3D9S8_9AGAM|nr:hypothetical protein SCLCIDRAFT_1223375 [Scleroderma citrinum Foug A]